MTAIASNLPNGRKLYLDGNGLPLSGGQVFYYTPGTTDLVTVYLDDGQTTPASNPVILDSFGTCSAFGVGEFREYVLDVLGNVISDAVVVASTPLTVTEAMRPVLEAATPADAEAILTASGSGFTNFNIPTGDQTLNVSPTGNPPNTRSTMNVQGMAQNADSREFLVNLGMDSSVGHGGIQGNDKVTLYAGIVAAAGSADVWSLNTLLTMQSNSGSYNAQGYELDFNNENAHRGNSGNLVQDYTAPIANAMSISGAGGFSSTTGLFINSPGNLWNRGLTLAGTNGVCAIQEWSSAPIGMQFDGAYQIAAINLTSVFGNAGAVCNTALFLKSNHTITWQSADMAHVISDVFDGSNRYVSLSSGPAHGIFLCGNTAPNTNATLQLGTSTNRWADIWGSNAVRLANTGALTWDINPTNNAGIGGFVVDFVDADNNRAVGSNAKTVYMGATTAPQTPNFDLGTATNTWGTVYSTGGLSTPSDIRLKDNVAPLSSMMDAVHAIDPIKYTWKDNRDKAVHFGFDAQEVHDTLGDFGGYQERDGKKFLRKDELIAVLWQAVKEMATRIEKLEDR